MTRTQTESLLITTFIVYCLRLNAKETRFITHSKQFMRVSITTTDKAIFKIQFAH